MDKKRMFSAIVLAAGLSSRLGAFKPMVKIGGRTLIERAVELFRSAEVNDITVVTGHRAQELQPMLDGLKIKNAVNPDYESGMFSSVRRGIESLDGQSQAFFMLPVDVPLVRPATVRTLVLAFEEHPVAKIFYPVFNGQRGHPPLIKAGLIPGILNWNGDRGLGGFLESQDALFIDMPVPDEAILWDVDAPEDMQRLEQKRQAMDVLSPGECRALMEDVHRLPAPIIAHCRAVAKIAKAMAKAVNQGGGALDVQRVFAAALVHDVARLQDNHAEKGAEMLADLGFPQMAEIVRVHMDIQVDPHAVLSESEIVYLADKMVSGDRPVDLNERFDRKMEKYCGDPSATKAIQRRKQNAMQIKVKVEKAAGRRLEAITAQADPAKGESQ